MDMAKVDELCKQTELANNRVSANMRALLTVKQLRKDVSSKRIDSFVLRMNETAVKINVTGKHGGAKRLQGLFDAITHDCKSAIAKDLAEITWCSEQLLAMLDN